MLSGDRRILRALQNDSERPTANSFHSYPRDIPDLQSLYLHRMDHDLISLVPSKLGFISHAALRAMTRGNPNITEVLWRDSLVDAAMFREWIVNVGQRPAASRLAHIVVELRKRLAITGYPESGELEMPSRRSRSARLSA